MGSVLAQRVGGWRARSVKILLSTLAVGLLALHAADKLKMDSIALGLAGLAFLPWLAELLESAELPGGWKVQFRKVEREQERLEQEVNWLKFLVANFLSQHEVRHLEKLASAESFWVEIDSPNTPYFDRELRRMLDLNLIRRLPGRGVRSLLYDREGAEFREGKAHKNVKGHFEITEEGRKYLAMRRQVGEST